MLKRSTTFLRSISQILQYVILVESGDINDRQLHYNTEKCRSEEIEVVLSTHTFFKADEDIGPI